MKQRTVRMQLWMAIFVLALALPVLIFAARGVELKRAVFGGVLAGNEVLLIGFATVEVGWPKKFMEWRSAVLREQPNMPGWASLGVDRIVTRPATDGEARDVNAPLLRAFGISLLIGGTIVQALVAWMLHLGGLW